MEYKWIGSHAQDLASGMMLAPGESAVLDDDEAADPFNKDLIDSGLLLPIDQKAAKTTAPKE